MSFALAAAYCFMITVVAYLILLNYFIKDIRLNNIDFWNDLGRPNIFDFSGESGFNMKLFFFSDLRNKVSPGQLKRINIIRVTFFIGILFFSIMSFMLYIDGNTTFLISQ